LHGDVLGDLLHSLSQPLTGLRCALELSLDLSPEEAAEHQQESVAVALTQTEKVIGMVQLMREYLDAEQPSEGAFSSALQSVLRNVIEELSWIAAVRDVQLRLMGSCTATVPLPEARLRQALQYLITDLIEAQPLGGSVILKLTDSPTGTSLCANGESISPATSAPTSTLQRVKLAIATRVLESMGASLKFVDNDIAPAGFVLHIPRRG